MITDSVKTTSALWMDQGRLQATVSLEVGCLFKQVNVFEWFY